MSVYRIQDKIFGRDCTIIDVNPQEALLKYLSEVCAPNNVIRAKDGATYKLNAVKYLYGHMYISAYEKKLDRTDAHRKNLVTHQTLIRIPLKTANINPLDFDDKRIITVPKSTWAVQFEDFKSEIEYLIITNHNTSKWVKMDKYEQIISGDYYRSYGVTNVETVIRKYQDYYKYEASRSYVIDKDLLKLATKEDAEFIVTIEDGNRKVDNYYKFEYTNKFFTEHVFCLLYGYVDNRTWNILDFIISEGGIKCNVFRLVGFYKWYKLNAKLYYDKYDKAQELAHFEERCEKVKQQLSPKLKIHLVELKNNNVSVKDRLKLILQIPTLHPFYNIIKRQANTSSNVCNVPLDKYKDKLVELNAPFKLSKYSITSIELFEVDFSQFYNYIKSNISVELTEIYNSLMSDEKFVTALTLDYYKDIETRTRNKIYNNKEAYYNAMGFYAKKVDSNDGLLSINRILVSILQNEPISFSLNYPKRQLSTDLEPLVLSYANTDANTYQIDNVKRHYSTYSSYIDNCFVTYEVTESELLVIQKQLKLIIASNVRMRATKSLIEFINYLNQYITIKEDVNDLSDTEQESYKSLRNIKVVYTDYNLESDYNVYIQIFKPLVESGIDLSKIRNGVVTDIRKYMSYIKEAYPDVEFNANVVPLITLYRVSIETFIDFYDGIQHGTSLMLKTYSSDLKKYLTKQMSNPKFDKLLLANRTYIYSHCCKLPNGNYLYVTTNLYMQMLQEEGIDITPYIVKSVFLNNTDILDSLSSTAKGVLFNSSNANFNISELGSYWKYIGKIYEMNSDFVDFMFTQLIEIDAVDSTRYKKSKHEIYIEHKASVINYTTEDCVSALYNDICRLKRYDKADVLENVKIILNKGYLDFEYLTQCINENPNAYSYKSEITKALHSYARTIEFSYYQSTELNTPYADSRTCVSYQRWYDLLQRGEILTSMDMNIVECANVMVKHDDLRYITIDEFNDTVSNVLDKPFNFMSFIETIRLEAQSIKPLSEEMHTVEALQNNLSAFSSQKTAMFYTTYYYAKHYDSFDASYTSEKMVDLLRNNLMYGNLTDVLDKNRNNYSNNISNYVDIALRYLKEYRKTKDKTDINSVTAKFIRNSYDNYINKNYAYEHTYYYRLRQLLGLFLVSFSDDLVWSNKFNIGEMLSSIYTEFIRQLVNNNYNASVYYKQNVESITFRKAYTSIISTYGKEVILDKESNLSTTLDEYIYDNTVDWFVDIVKNKDAQGKLLNLDTDEYPSEVVSYALNKLNDITIQDIETYGLNTTDIMLIKDNWNIIFRKCNVATPRKKYYDFAKYLIQNQKV